QAAAGGTTTGAGQPPDGAGFPWMSTPRPLELTSTVDALAAALRPRILEGELAAGARLREQELSDDYGVARHTLRAALRALAAEGPEILRPHIREATAAIIAGGY